MPPLLSEYVDSGGCPSTEIPTQISHDYAGGKLFKYFYLHKAELYLPPEVQKSSCSGRVQCTRGRKLAEESFVNMSPWGGSTRMPGLVQTCYLPSYDIT